MKNDVQNLIIAIVRRSNGRSSYPLCKKQAKQIIPIGGNGICAKSFNNFNWITSRFRQKIYLNILFLLTSSITN
jgi:hypothetical protein